MHSLFLFLSHMHTHVHTHTKVSLKHPQTRQGRVKNCYVNHKITANLNSLQLLGNSVAAEHI